MNKNKTEKSSAVFVDEHRNIHKGEKALQMIKEKDGPQVKAGEGVLAVDRERWEEAQRYERRTWMDGKAGMTDRNEDHCEKFSSYTTLRGRHYSKVIELGSGPFTNLRLILENATADEIHVLDPLMDDYLQHPYCRYRDGKFGGVFTTSIIPFSFRGGLKHPVRFLRHKFNEWKIGKFGGREIKMHKCGIEDLKIDTEFDLVVMINVIEHCRDMNEIFSQILKLLKPGGTFVYSDKMYDSEEELEKAKHHYDAGHPIRVDYRIIENFLEENFDPELESIVTNRQSKDNERKAPRYRYFIGQKKN